MQILDNVRKFNSTLMKIACIIFIFVSPNSILKIVHKLNLHIVISDISAAKKNTGYVTNFL